MLIAQITDIHIGFDPDNPAEYNRKRLDDVLDVLIEGPNRPDLLLATGDITDRGDSDSYRRLATAFSRCPFPVWPSVGNHDLRDNFHAQFPGFGDGNGFVQYVIDLPQLRLVTVDTLEEGRHGGAFCEARAAWLDAELANGTSFEDFFAQAPAMNPARSLITGVVCGVRVEDVEEETMREIRYLDKLIDELAKGKAMGKILRQ